MTDLRIKQGSDGGRQWPIYNTDGTPFNLTGYTVKSQIRSLSGNLLHEFSTSLGNAVIAGNTITLTWTHTQTTGWRWEEGRYDLEITSPGGAVTPIDKGFVTVSKEVTL